MEAVTVEKDIPAVIGKVVSLDETKRTFELVSGTIKTNHR